MKTGVRLNWVRIMSVCGFSASGVETSGSTTRELVS
jgi:hypothetical protein